MGKRALISLILMAVMILVASGLVSAADSWKYYFPITVSDNSGATRNAYPIILGVGGQTLVDSGYMTANGTDARMRTTADKNFMLSTDNIVFAIDSLPAYGQVTYNLYTGYSPEISSFQIIVGDGGYVTVADEASIELGDNFTIEQGGWVNTDNGSNKNLVHKKFAFKTYVDQTVSENITSEINSQAAEAIVDSYVGSDDELPNIYGVNWETQTFTSPTNFELTKISIFARKYGNPGIVTASIRATSGGEPTGVDLTSGTVDGNAWSPTTLGWREIDLTDYYLWGGVQYALVIRATSGNPTNTAKWSIDNSSPTYSGGSYGASTDNGSSWAMDTSRDAVFRIYGEEEAVSASVSATGVSSGEHTVKTTYDSSGTIDIGVAAIDRDSGFASNYTVFGLDNPATVGGVIETVEIWAQDSLSNAIVGTFFLVSGTTYECRDSEVIGAVTAGSKQTFSGLSIDVQSGDYIGIYFTAGSVELSSAGYAGVYFETGEYIDPGDQATYSLLASEAMSLYGTDVSLNFKIYIDDVEEDSVSTGVTVPDNSNDWTFLQNNVMPYADNITISVNGTQELWLQPIAMITGTNLPDRATSVSNNGTITWGSNDQVSITFGSVISYEGTTSEVSANETGFLLPTVGIPENWWGMSFDGTGLPFYPTFLDTATQTGIPTQTLYLFVVFGIAIALATVTIVLTRSVVVGVAFFTVTMAYGTSAGIVPGWMIYTYLIMFAGIIFLSSRQNMGG